MLPLVCMIIITLYSLFLYANSSYLLLQSLYTLFLYFRMWRSKQPQHYQPYTKSQHINECTVCLKPKPPRFYHCRRCRNCVYRMDHHCDWFGCCIGQFNGKLYIHSLFNLIVMSSLYVIDRTFSWDWNILKIILMMVGIFCIMESGRLLRDYLYSIKNNQTLIQTYKEVRGRRKPQLKKWQQILGSNRIGWILPTFAGLGPCNLYEEVYKESENASIHQYTYADEYLYGIDDEDESKLK